MFNTKLIKNIALKSSPFMKKIACIDGGGFLVSVLGAKMAQKLKQKKNGQNFQLTHRKAQKSILSGRFGDPSVQESGRSVLYPGELA